MNVSNPLPKVGIGVLIYNTNKQILLARRKSKHGLSTWGPPGGHLEFGESFEQCAIRETLEETGILIKNPEFLALTNDIFEDHKHYISIFMQAVFPNQKILCPEPDKFSEWQWFSLENLPKPLFNPLENLVEGKFYPSNLSSSLF